MKYLLFKSCFDYCHVGILCVMEIDTEIKDQLSNEQLR